jgi:3-oxoacyl-[acyl-carrier protein] reductase
LVEVLEDGDAVTLARDPAPHLLVTGVGGSIGTAIINQLEKSGAHLIKLSQKGLASEGTIVDFADDIALSHAVEKISGKLDGIVIAHGVLKPGPFARVKPSEWRTLLDVNLNSVYVILHSAVHKLRSGSSIVVVSSTAGFDHSPVGGPHYTVSKWALNGLVRHLAADLGKSGIRVNAICPGFVDNSMGRAFLTDQQLEAAIASIPLKRGATPAEIAGVVEFLLSKAASYITGALVPVSGGYR